MILKDLPVERRSSQPAPADIWLGRLRLLLMCAGMLGVSVLLVARMWDLQVNNADKYRKQGKDNSTREIESPALRGLVYDRNGVPLVLNAPAYQVTILPGEFPFYFSDTDSGNRAARAQENLTHFALVNQLAELLAQAPLYRSDDPLNIAPTVSREVESTITAGEIHTRVVSALRRGETGTPLIIAENVPRQLALILQERAINLPGVSVQVVGSRIYPHKALTGAFMGYIAKIPAERAKSYLDKGYASTDRVGVSGIESVVEDDVRGRKGRTTILRDVSGEEKEVVGEAIQPQDGYGVRLTLDLRLQKILSETLSEAMRIRNTPRAAAVALDPSNGQVLAMWGAPTYDNNIFIRGITQKELDDFQADIHKPQLNKATQDRVPPGSIFKIVTTAALLEEGIVNEQTRTNDPGIFTLPNRFFAPPLDEVNGQKFYCWKRDGHGSVGIRDALRQSCDTFYYKFVGGFQIRDNVEIPENRALNADRLANWAKKFGISEEPEIEVAASQGFAPTPLWKRNTYGEIWTTGDNYNVSIGQGQMLVTPLEMANMVAVIANGGTLYAPKLVKEVIDREGNVVRPYTSTVIRKDFMKPSTVKLIQDTMVDVLGARGTAPGAAIPGFTYAGKTGTAEFCDDIAQKLRLCYVGIKEQPTHAWFVSYAPALNPKIALAVYVWNGGQGSGVAAPITQRIYNEYFELGIPTDKLAPIEKGKGGSE